MSGQWEAWQLPRYLKGGDGFRRPSDRPTEPRLMATAGAEDSAAANSTETRRSTDAGASSRCCLFVNEPLELLFIPTDELDTGTSLAGLGNQL